MSNEELKQYEKQFPHKIHVTIFEKESIRGTVIDDEFECPLGTEERTTNILNEYLNYLHHLFIYVHSKDYKFPKVAVQIVNGVKQPVISRPSDLSQKYKVTMTIGDSVLGTTNDLYEFNPSTLESNKVTVTARTNIKDVCIKYICNEL